MCAQCLELLASRNMGRSWRGSSKGPSGQGTWPTRKITEGAGLIYSSGGPIAAYNSLKENCRGGGSKVFLAVPGDTTRKKGHKLHIERFK